MSANLPKFSVVDEDSVPTMAHYTLDSPNHLQRRPSLQQLHKLQDKNNDTVKPLDINTLEHSNSLPNINPIHIIQDEIMQQDKPVDTVHLDIHTKFGWIRGVLLRCILSILGTLFYLRLAWLAGQAGILLGTVVALLSTLIVTITALSMCALCTNGLIFAGGAYYMLSRSLGPKFGGSMGVIFALADAVASAMNVVGFAEAVRDLLKTYGLKIIDSSTNDVRIIGWITMTVLFIIVMISVSWEAKTEIALFIIIAISYINYIVGTFIPPNATQKSFGMTGFSRHTFVENLYPKFRGETFLSVFAVYFPSMTGIMAGAGISGELKEPDKALPKGTLLGIFVTTMIYLSGIWLTGATVVRQASGNVTDVINGTAYFSCAIDESCPHGLLDSEVMQMESGYWPLLVAGIFATSISSALTLLVTSPRTIQAVAKDNIFPKTQFLAVLSGKDQEPRRAYAVVFIVALMVIAIGDLNSVAPLISNFYLASFALINLACFVGSYSNAPGWRPAFKYFNQWVALFGGALCIIAMLVMNWYMALVTYLIMGFLYFFVHRNKPNVNWGASGPAQAYSSTLTNLNRMAFTEGHVKNYRPQILILTGNPLKRPGLVNLISNITKDQSLLICGDVVLNSEYKHFQRSLNEWRRQIQLFYKTNKIHAFYNPTMAPTFIDGCHALFQLAGLGHFKPDILVTGYKTNWKKSNSIEDIKSYFQLIHDAFSDNLSLIIAHDRGFDLTEKIEMCTLDKICSTSKLTSPYDENKTDSDSSVLKSSESDVGLSMSISEENIPASYSLSDVEMSSPRGVRRRISCSDSETSEDISTDFGLSNITARRIPLEQKIQTAFGRFRKRIKNGTIDVWWLFDDGGLTLLVSHLMTSKGSYLKNARIRLFVYAKNVNETEKEKKEMYELLQKFRINVAEVTIITDFDEAPKVWTQDKLDRTIRKFRMTDDSEAVKEHPHFYITDSEFGLLKHKTSRQLRTRELIMEHSKNANLIIVTLPIPKVGRESATLYLTWLDMLTVDLTNTDTPVLLIRGNQTNVLTFYS